MVGPGTAGVERAVIRRFEPMAPAAPAQPILLAGAAAPVSPDAAPPGTPGTPATDLADVAPPDVHAAHAADLATALLAVPFHYTVHVRAFGEVERAAALQPDLAARYPEAAGL